MRFYDREMEMEVLRRNRELSKKGGVFTVLTGRRRVGKTKLIKESEEGNRFLYFFVERSSETVLCEQLSADARTCLGIKLFNSGRFCDLFEQLMKYGIENNFTFMLDEFQELDVINKSIMSSIQNLWDSYKSVSKVNLIVCGSVHSMMVRIFGRYSEPLFGRATSKMNIRCFRPGVVKEILKDHNPDYVPDDLLFLHMVAGGTPKYIEVLMDEGATSLEKMLDHICSHNSIFLTEGKDLLILEFGKEYGTYYSILKMIAMGKNTFKEIEDSVGRGPGTYLANLENDYILIRRDRPIFSKENSKDTRWYISDNYLRFYFRFISGNRLLVEMEQYDVLKEIIRGGYLQYSGSVLENYFKEKMIEEERITNIGSHWDRKGQNEIDIIAVNDMSKKAIVAEVKRDPKKASVSELKRRSELVPELKGYDVEYRVLSLDDM
jgi:AAA+ ATPase superfamily predicted ATPase